jgi:tRNA nucleotidyltransferase (CCA-adding enzyme)
VAPGNANQLAQARDGRARGEWALDEWALDEWALDEWALGEWALGEWALGEWVRGEQAMRNAHDETGRLVSLLQTENHPLAGRRTLVGGALRDSLRGERPKDRDWLVVGIHSDELRSLGFRPVGKNFQVFLCPRTHEEYALPRDVPDGGSGDDLGDILHDLARRDFTINAMAATPGGVLVDPHGGRRDLQSRQLRHVHSGHFADDPLRALRAARFAANFNLSITPHTRALSRWLAGNGAVTALPKERLVGELERGLTGPAPGQFVRQLRSSGLLRALLPEVDALFGIPQPARYHPEIDTGVHTLMALDVGRDMCAGAASLFAILLHDVGKALTPPGEWPSHRDHETNGAPIVEAIAGRLGLSQRTTDVALRTTIEHLNVHRAGELRAGKMLKLLVALRALSQGSILDDVLVACEADARGRLGLAFRHYPSSDWLRACAKAASAVTAGPLAAQGLQGPALGEALAQERRQALGALRKNRPRNPD